VHCEEILQELIVLHDQDVVSLGWNGHAQASERHQVPRRKPIRNGVGPWVSLT
jgi:hypothetical protein